MVRRRVWGKRRKTQKISKKLEKSEKTFAKGLDKWYEKWYNNGAVNETASRRLQAKRLKKVFKKTLKNLLTNGTGCDIINKSPTERRRSQKKQAWERMRYNLKPLQRANEKSLKKLLKNLLTKASGCDIIRKSPEQRRRSKKIAHWKLNNNVLRKTPKILLNLQKLLNSN